MNLMNKIKGVVLLHIFFLLFTYTVHAQEVYRPVSSKTGPSSKKPRATTVHLNKSVIFQSVPENFDYNNIHCILKDYKGYMWFATINGLVRYDGVNVYLYEHNPDDSTSLSHNNINAIVEDKDKNLWIGTSIGLNLYNRDKDDFIRAGTNNNSTWRLGTNYVSSLCADKNSLLWVGTFGDGINVYDYKKQRLKHYANYPDTPDSLSTGRVTSLACDSENNIAVGSYNGLFLFLNKDNKFQHFITEKNNPSGLSSNIIMAVTFDKENNLWIGTQGGGINKMIRNGGGFLFDHYPYNSQIGSLSNNYVLSLDADKHGNLWVGTENGGLWRLKIKSNDFDVFQTDEGNNNSISSNSIWSLYTDNEDILWIGTFNKGVNIIDEKFNKFESYKRNIISNSGLTDNDVTGFAEDDKGNVWIATDGGGICRFVPKKRQFNKTIDNSSGQCKLVNNAIQKILFDSKGYLWVGTWAGGIDRLSINGTSIENYKLENNEGAGNNDIISLYEDSKGNIWAGTSGSGLFKFNKHTDSFKQAEYTGDAGILTKTAYVTSVFEDSEGALWVGTLYGLVVLQNQYGGIYTCKNYSRHKRFKGLSSNMIEVIFEDSKKRLWFGTGDNGLNLFNKKDSTFTIFQKKDGLPSNSIMGILEDDNGNLWLTSKIGLCRFNFDSLSFMNYTREDGLNSNEFYANSCLRTKSGKFFIGGENGFNVFDPKNIKQNTTIPPVYFSGLKINNIPVTIESKKSPLNKFIGETSEIKLNYKQSSFTVEFVALNYTHSSRNKFEYKLEGFDNDWNRAGTSRNASYTNIKPGRYVFLVKGSNNDGVWNPIPARLAIRITPPFWKTWWAIICYILIITFLTLLSLRIWHERLQIKNLLELEQLAREKEHELNERNIEFFTNISHEFRTPLSLIIAPLEGIIATTHSKLKEQLQVICRNAQRLLQLTNDLMDFRKLEEGLAMLNLEEGEIIEFVAKVSACFNINAKKQDLTFTTETSVENIRGWFDHEKLETVLLNLLSNAFKHIPDKGSIAISTQLVNPDSLVDGYKISPESICRNSRYVEIAVTDNGPGIKDEDMPYVFDKFYQTKVSKKDVPKGTGIGLALTKGLVEMHHGFIKVKSIPHKKTQFCFVVPVDPLAYKPDELFMQPVDIEHKPTQTEYAGNNYPETNPGQKEINPEEEKYTILIVEDNFELRTFLVNELNKEYIVLAAEDGEKGIGIACSNIPDLIISDIVMPKLTGIELCKTIKSDIRTSHIPVIMLTAKTEINDHITGIETGADIYINKPFNMKLLHTQIHHLIDSRRKLFARFSQEAFILPNKMARNEIDQEFLQGVIGYIQENIADNNMNVDSLAESLGMSRSSLYRKITALTGNTIVEFIKVIRLKQAIKLLETQKYTIAEIAYKTGFSSPAYFTKTFKDQYGKPPSEFIGK